MDNFSLYVHIPFCLQRCGYCDFNSTAGRLQEIPIYIEMLCKEAQLLACAAPEPLQVHSIFFGGGTPSLVPIKPLRQIMQTISNNYALLQDCEITLESNPKTISKQYLDDLLSLGFNRLSIGMQSARKEDLEILQRLHNHQDLVNSVYWARQAGFKNINLDLIFGIPRQTLDGWKESVEEAIKLAPQHLSLYALTLEPNTPLFNQVNCGSLPPLDDDISADMYEWAGEFLEQHNYTQYEISNWGLNQDHGGYFACRHNLQYWLNLPYLGLGAGAHGSTCGMRMANESDLDAYIQLLSGNTTPGKFPLSAANCEVNSIDRRTEMQETMMVGLRLTKNGISNRKFSARFGLSLNQAFGEKIDRLVKTGLLEWVEIDLDVIRLTKRGRLLGNQVFMQFVGED